MRACPRTMHGRLFVCLLLPAADLIEGFDPRDSTSVEGLSPTASSSAVESALEAAFAPGAPRAARRLLEGVTVGIPDEYNLEQLSPAMRLAWHRVAGWLAEEAGARVVSVSLPHTRHALPAYYILAPAEAMSNLSRYDGVRYGHALAKAEQEAATAAASSTLAGTTAASPSSSPTSRFSSSSQQLDAGPPAMGLREYYTSNRSTGFGPEVQRRILVGSFVLSSRAVEGFYAKAQRIRRAITSDFLALFRAEEEKERVHVLLTPTCVGTALSFERIQKDRAEDPVSVCALSLSLGTAIACDPLAYLLDAHLFRYCLLPLLSSSCSAQFSLSERSFHHPFQSLRHPFPFFPRWSRSCFLLAVGAANHGRLSF